jgi:hypothetical protein
MGAGAGNSPAEIMALMRASRGKHPGVGARIILRREYEASLCVSPPPGE